MSITIHDLAKASDAINTALLHLARVERSGLALAATTARNARQQLEDLNVNLLTIAHEIDSDSIAAMSSCGEFPP